jgi:ADP-ribose pyrophosphatase
MSNNIDPDHAVEKTVTSNTVYSGRVVTLRIDTVQGPNGRATREIIDHADAVCVVPIELPNTVYLVSQYRKAIETTLIEAPAGCMEAGECPLTAAQRELKEETGFDANIWVPLGKVVMAPGFCNEMIHLFMAQGLVHGNTSFDSDECMTMTAYSIQDVTNMVARGEIYDAKTIIALGRVMERLRE